VSETLPPQPASGSGPDEGPGDPGLLDRAGANRFVRLALLVGLLAWAAITSLWLFMFIMALVVSIFLHEMGHFLMAKRAGMKVTEFFLGFGPRIWSFRRGETEYGLKVIPAGAYVKIIGMSNIEEVAPEDEERSYRAKSFGKRLPVVLGGPVMNLLLGFLLLVVVFAGFGRESDSNWTVRNVTVGSAAEQAGIQGGDRIVAFEGQAVSDWDDLVSQVQARAGTTSEVTVERDGQELTIPVTLGWSLTGASGAALGLETGDRVTSVDDTPVSTYADLVGALQRAQGRVTLTYTRDQETATVEVQGPVDLPADAYKGFLGVSQDPVIERVPVVEAVPAAGSQFGEIVVGSVQGMGRLFSPSGISNLFQLVANAQDDDPATPAVEGGSGSGQSSSSSTSSSSSSSGSASENADRPISILGIVNIGSQAGEVAGWAGALGMLALVNIFLGLINLLPLLPFDGGHVVVACYEEIRGRLAHRPYRVDMAKLMPVTYVVLLLLGGLFLSTLYLDVVDPISIK